MAASISSLILICFLTYIPSSESSGVIDGLDTGNSSFASCPGYACDDSDPSMTPLCHCDRLCTGYGDCCWSAKQTLADGSPKDANLRRETCISTGYPATQSTNVVYDYDPLRDPYFDSLPFGYFMVDTCLPGLQDASLLRRCSSKRDTIVNPLASWDEYRDYVPVVDDARGVTYKNVHCARCNVVRYSDMIPWNLHTDMNCSVEVLPEDCAALAFRPPAVYTKEYDYTPRSCFRVDVSSCPASTNSSETIVDLCSSYSAPFDLSGVSYRNHHCAECNDETFTVGMYHCPVLGNTPGILPDPEDGRPRLPQVIPFDFSLNEGDDDTIYFCAPGLLFNDTSESCELSPNSTEVTLDELCGIWNFSSDSLHMVIKSREPMDPTGVLGVMQSMTSLGNTGSWYVAACADEVLSSIRCFVVTIRGVPGYIFPNNDEIDRELERSHLDLDEVERITSCANRTPQLGDCTQTGVYNESDITTYTHGDNYYVIIQSKNRVYWNVVMEIEILSAISSAGGRNTLKLSFCGISDVDLKCPYSFLSADEFSAFPVQNSGMASASSDAVEFRLNGTESILHPREYILQPDNRSKVCSNRIGLSPEPYETFLLIVFLVFTTLSLIALVLTFANYCMFKPLRNLPGILTMNFIVALFFAQLVLIASYLSPTNKAMCIFISLLGHFMWLATFLWMSNIAFNLARTFGSMNPNGHPTNQKGTIIRYSLIGWLAPAFFVAVCILTQTFTDLGKNFSYGTNGEGNCWIAPGAANLLLFGVPAMLCLLCNVVMFAITVRGIQKSKKGAKMATKASTSTIAKEQAILYIKISALIGLSWIWAFLYGFFPVVPLLFIHTFVNPLQGVFVFVVYVCNRRTLAMWSEKPRHSRGASHEKQSLNLVSLPTSSTRVSENPQ